MFEKGKENERDLEDQILDDDLENDADVDEPEGDNDDLGEIEEGDDSDIELVDDENGNLDVSLEDGTRKQKVSQREIDGEFDPNAPRSRKADKDVMRNIARRKAAEAKVGHLEDQLSEMGKSLQTLAHTQKISAINTQRDRINNAAMLINAEIQGAEEAYQEARQANDGAAEMRAMKLITAKQGQLSQLQTLKGQLDNAERVVRTTLQSRPKELPMANKFVNQNSWWHDQPGYERETEQAERISDELQRRGYTTDDPQYWNLLERNIQKKAPHLYDIDDDEGDVPMRKTNSGSRRQGGRSRSPVASGGRSGGGGSQIVRVPTSYKSALGEAGLEQSSDNLKKLAGYGRNFAQNIGRDGSHKTIRRSTKQK